MSLCSSSVRSEDVWETDDEVKEPAGPAPFPMMGTYITFRIDALATVEDVDGEEAKLAAQSMTCNRYLGYVSELRTLDHTQSYIAYNIAIISQGIPERDEEQGIKPDMCVPILPATHHPVGRRPLRPNKPLPFENCYEHTHFPIITVRAKTDRREYKDAFRLSIARQVREEELGQKDRSRRRRLVKGIRKGGPVEPGDTDSSDEETEESGYQTPVERGSDEGSNDDSSQELEPADIMAVVFAQGIADDTMVVITDISYDIASCSRSSFSQPQDFFKEQEYLRKLVKDAKQKAIDRARKLDAEMYGESSTPVKRRTWAKRFTTKIKCQKKRFTRGWRRFLSWFSSDSRII